MSCLVIKPRKMYIRLLLSLVIGLGLAAVPTHPVEACTIVVKTDGENVLVGNNEDFLEPRTKIWFRARDEVAYGRVIWGYDRYLYPFQGGMNEKGLFIDINAIGFSGWQNDPEKPDLTEDVVDYILSNCANLEQAMQVFQELDIGLGWVKYVIADASGSSAVFEWLDGSLNVVTRSRSYQISTNYLSSKDPTEPRYQIADQILSRQPRATVDLIRKALAATSYDVDLAQTLYSTICDLKNLKVYLYNFHFFEEVVVFDIPAELAKGDASYSIPSLFEFTTHNEHWFNHLGTLIGARDLMKVIEEKGIEAAEDAYRTMSEEKRTFHRYHFPEWSMRSMGLHYLEAGQFENAIGILHITAKDHPESWEAYADLARAHAMSGDRSKAILNYEKALDINPESSELRRALGKMREHPE